MKGSDKSLFSDNSKIVHLVGIGGVSMSALAEVLNHRGFVVHGSDMQESDNIARLRKLGIKVIVGHSADNIGNADIVIRTSAIHDDNPEIMRARELNLQLLERAEAWGELMEEYKEVVCVSGTHGKTTTTSMITHIALEARLNPQVMVGAYLPIINGGVRVASGDLFIAEACEYCNSFLNFNPTVAVIGNVEEDHLDFFKDIDDIVSSFRAFAEKVPATGAVIANYDDENAMRAIAGIERTQITFGMSDGADVMAKNISYSGGCTEFTLLYKGEELCKINLSVAGKHNVYNALAAAAASLFIGISPKCIAAGLLKFTGAGRRFERKGEVNGADVYDDYAHHPSEVEATLKTVKDMGYKRVICVFQPHTYTRTAALKDDFIEALKYADKVLLGHIYAAREKNTIGISSQVIADGIQDAEYIEDFDGLALRLSELAEPGDLILTMGAGDIYKVGEMLVDEKIKI